MLLFLLAYKVFSQGSNDDTFVLLKNHGQINTDTELNFEIKYEDQNAQLYIKLQDNEPELIEFDSLGGGDNDFYTYSYPLYGNVDNPGKYTIKLYFDGGAEKSWQINVVEKISCTLVDPDEGTKYKYNSTIKFSCQNSQIEEGFSLKAYLHKDEFNPQVTMYPLNTDTTPYTLDLSTNEDTRSIQKITLALVKGDDVTNEMNIKVQIYGIPIISQFSFDQENEEAVVKGTNLDFTIVIEDTFDATKGTLEYCIFESKNAPENGFGDADKQTVTLTNSDTNSEDFSDSDSDLEDTSEQVQTTFTFKFSFTISENTKAGSYFVRAIFTDAAGQTSTQSDSYSYKVKANSLSCTLVNSDNGPYTYHSVLKFECSDLFKEEGFNLKGKIGKLSNTPDDYNLTIGDGTYYHTLDLQENKAENKIDYITLALVSDSAVSNPQQFEVNLYGKPVISALTLSSPSNTPIQKGTELTFSIKISETYDATKGTLEFCIFKSEEALQSGFGESSKTPADLTKSDTDDTYTFPYTVTESSGSYIVRAIFTDPAGQESSTLDSSAFQVESTQVNSLSCTLVDPGDNPYTYKSSVKFECSDYFAEPGYQLKGKIGENSEVSTEYTYDLTNSESIFTLNLSKNTNEAKISQISLALVSDSAVSKAQQIEVKLYGKPSISGLNLNDPEQTITIGTELTFSFSIENTFDTSNAKIKYKSFKSAPDPITDDLLSDVTPVDANGLSLTFTVPDDYQDNEVLLLLIQFIDNAGQESSIKRTEEYTVRVSKISDCEIAYPDNTKYRYNSDSVTFNCPSYIEIDGVSLKAKISDPDAGSDYLDKKSDATGIVFDFSQNNDDTSVKQITLALIKGDDDHPISTKAINVQLYGKPVLSAFRNGSDTEFSSGMNLSFYASITNTFNILNGLIKYRLIDNNNGDDDGIEHYDEYNYGDLNSNEGDNKNSDENQASWLPATDFKLSDGNNNFFGDADEYSFVIQIPEDIGDGQKNLEIIYLDETGQESAEAYEDEIFIISNTMESCRVAEESTFYTYNSNQITVRCENFFIDRSSQLMAKIGEKSSNIKDYKFHGNTDSNGDLVFDFHENNDTSKVKTITIAIIKGSAISSAQELEIKLYGKPVISKLELSKSVDTNRIQRKTPLAFSMTVDQTFDLEEINPTIQYQIYKHSELPIDKTLINSISAIVVDSDHQGEIPTYIFTILVPEQVDATTYVARIMFTDYAEQNSDIIEYQFEVKVNNLSCISDPSVAQYKYTADAVKLKCENTFIEDGYSLKAKLNENDQFTFYSKDEGEGIYTIDFRENPNTESKSSIIVALVGNSETIFQQNVEVKLLGIPEISALLLREQLPRLPRETAVTKPNKISFIVTVGNSFNIGSGKIKVAHFTAADADKHKDFTGLESKEITQIDIVNESANKYKFEYDITNDFQFGTYKLIAQYIDVFEQNSSPFILTDNFTVYEDGAKSIQCGLFEGQSTTVQSHGKVVLNCEISHPNLVHPAIEAQPSENFDDKGEAYPGTIEDIEGSTHKKVTINLEGNTKESDKIVVAMFIGDTKSGIAPVNVNIIPKPIITEFSFMDNMPAKIHRTDVLKFKFTLDAPTKTATTTYIKASAGSTEITPKTSAELKDLGSHMYSFEYKVPEDYSAVGLISLEFEVQNMAGESTVETLEFTVEDTASAVCTPVNNYNKADGDLQINCKVSQILKSINEVSYSFDGKDIATAPINDGAIKIKLDNHKDEVSKMTIKWNQGQETLHSVTIDVFIFPRPSIKSIKNISPRPKYFYGKDITLEIVIEKFFMLNKATIKYEFVNNKNDDFANPETLKSKLVDDKKPNQYKLVIPTPLDDHDSTRFLKMEFTDLSGQTASYVLEDNFIILHSYVVEASHVTLMNQKFKKGELIIMNITLSNLKEDWKKSIKFKYRFEGYEQVFDLPNENIISDEQHARKISATSIKNTFTLLIPVQDKIPKSTKVHAYAVDKDGNQISTEVSSDYFNFDSESSQEGPPNDKPKFLIPIIAVVGVVVVIIVVVAIVYFVVKKRKFNKEQHELSDFSSTEDVVETKDNIDAEKTKDNGFAAEQDSSDNFDVSSSETSGYLEYSSQATPGAMNVVRI